jgi:hypothetical protein
MNELDLGQFEGHSPTPWEFDGRSVKIDDAGGDYFGVTIYDAKGNELFDSACRCGLASEVITEADGEGGCDRWDEQARRDARLAAAAPALLAELRAAGKENARLVAQQLMLLEAPAKDSVELVETRAELEAAREERERLRAIIADHESRWEELKRNLQHEIDIRTQALQGATP